MIHSPERGSLSRSSKARICGLMARLKSSASSPVTCSRHMQLLLASHPAVVHLKSCLTARSVQQLMRHSSLHRQLFLAGSDPEVQILWLLRLLEALVLESLNLVACAAALSFKSHTSHGQALAVLTAHSAWQCVPLLPFLQCMDCC